MRRDVFASLGGFTEDEGTGHEDWELWAKARRHRTHTTQMSLQTLRSPLPLPSLRQAVLRGYRLQVVPEPLYWYRLAGGGIPLVQHKPHVRPAPGGLLRQLCLVSTKVLCHFRNAQACCPNPSAAAVPR